ncbi:MAG: DUF4199 domain-containing protein [Bacteroidetes bacterium HGW-Bacteroidetes-2]|jgi:hypothetical protein|nr:MAG: DUF4199 domain-containing protein [Bacteroidetes bacterium HGW-Bacteroidetes-2]
MNKLYFKYGMGIAIFLIVYFLILKIIGLHIYPVLSAFNGVIIGAGVFMAISDYKNNHKHFKFEKGFQAGLYSGALGSALFSLFMAIYIYHLDENFAEQILGNWESNYNYPSLLIFTILIMGLATSFILTLAFMQLLKETWNTTPKKNGNI